MLDFYCERSGAEGLWVEPFNAVSNVAFLAAGIAAWLFGRRRGSLTVGVYVLVTLAVALAVGSTLFHTVHVRWTKFADVGPILLFQLSFLTLYLRVVMGFGIGFTVVAVAAYSVSGLIMQGLPKYWEGTLVYSPTVACMAGLGVWHLRRQKRGPSLLLAAAVVFCVALVFRGIDRSVCDCFPIGTHFLWHLFNGVLLYLAIRIIILNQPDAEKNVMPHAAGEPRGV